MRGKKFKDIAVTRKRLTVVIWFITLAFAVLLLRLAYIMIVKRGDFSSRAEEQWTSEVIIDARRGRILDRYGVELAVSADVYRVDFDLNSVRQYLKANDLTTADIAPLISDALNIDEDEVLEKLETKLSDGSNAGSATLIRRIEKDLADKVSDLGIDGVIISPDTKRYYPFGEYLAHVLGCTNVDGEGLTGIELEYNEELSGVPGVRTSEIVRDGEKISYVISEYTDPIEGKDVTLTIDSKLQSFAEKIAEKGLVENQAKRVSVMIMDPDTGEILAMVNKPDYDPNNPFEGYEDYAGSTDAEKLQAMWRNSLVNDTFEPGSIFKVFTMIAALESGTVTGDETFECGGSLQVGSHTIKCWKTAGHGTQSLSQILQNSCNVGFMKLGAMIGKETLNKYISLLGFGSLTEVDLPGEAEGIIKSTESITESDLATISFGQTNTLTAMQYMMAYNAIANGGDLIQPHLMKEISHINSEGTTVVDETFDANVEEDVLSEESTAILRDFLERTVNQGGSNKTYIEGYSIGAKTGTAQKVNSLTGGYESGKYISSIAAMIPADDPELTVFITIDEPSAGAYYAGTVAAPLMKDLLTDIINYSNSDLGNDYLNIDKEVVLPDVRGMSISEAKAALSDVGINCTVEGDGDIIIKMEPYPGYILAEGTTITLYAGSGEYTDNTVVMPDLIGYSIEDAVSLLEELGLNFNYDGTGYIIDQSIEEGTEIKTGDTIDLTLYDEYGD